MVVLNTSFKLGCEKVKQIKLTKLKASSRQEMPTSPWDPPAPTPPNDTARGALPHPQITKYSINIFLILKILYVVLCSIFSRLWQNPQLQDHIRKAHAPLWHKLRYASLLFRCIVSFKLFFQVIKHFINIFFYFKNIVCCSLLLNL